MSLRIMLRIVLINSNTVLERAGVVEAAGLRLFTGSLTYYEPPE
jgi:hypothetical protein